MLENLKGVAAPVDQGPAVQIPIGTPVALLVIEAALQFFPTIIGNLGGSLGSNQGGSKDVLGTIEHDIQHFVTDIVGIFHHQQDGHF